MEQKQFDDLVAKVGAEAAKEIKSQVEAATKGMATKEEILTMLNEFTPDVKSIKIGEKSIEDILREQGAEITNMKQTPVVELTLKNIEESIKSEMESRKDEWEAMKGKSAPFVIELKAAGTMTTANVPTAANSFVPSSQLLPGVIPYKTNTPLVLQYANTFRTSARTIHWVDETAGEGDAGWTAEGATKPLQDVNVTVRNVTATKVAVVAKASEESLADIPFLASLIETRLRNSLNLKIDDGLLNGDGTGDQPYGIGYYAPAFTSTEMNDSVDEANYFDALGAAATQIIRANFQPNIVFINPVDWFKMMHTKDDDKGYVLLQLQMQNGSFLGMTAVKSNQVEVGEFIMGDMQYFRVAIREDIRLEIGWENDDFRKNLRTLIMEGRLSSFVSENEKLAFVKDEYQNVIDAITIVV